MDLDEKLKSLLEELQLSDEAIIKFKLMVESYLTEKTKELNESHNVEIESLQEEINSLQEELEFVQEKAEQFGEMLQEKAEEYGQMLIEKADAYAETLIEQADQYGEAVAASTLEDANKYAEYVVENFIEENKQTLIKEDEYNRMKNVFESIKESFESNAFLIEATSESIDAAMQRELDETKEQYNKIFEDYSTLKAEVSSLKKEKIFESKTQNLADTQKEKVIHLIESLKPKSLDEYGKAIDIIVSELDNKSVITESVSQTKETKPTSDRMSIYLNSL